MNATWDTTTTVEFTNEEIESLKILVDVISENPSEAPELFCAQVKTLSNLLPQRIKTILDQFKLRGSVKGFLLFKWPLVEEDLPPTPSENKFKVGETMDLAKLQALFMQYMGELISYEAEGYGRLFQDVVPSYKMACEQTSMGSAKELEIHTEQAFSELRPDVLSLSCLRGDLLAYTYVLPVRRFLDHFVQSEFELLFEPLWKIGVDLSFKLGGNEFIYGDDRGPIPILYKGAFVSDLFLVFDQDLMRGITPKAEELKHRMISIYNEYKYRINLKSGDIIFIDNRRAVHGRSPFCPTYDGKDRFLVRCFSTFDFEKSAYARKDKDDPEHTTRMVNAIYS